MQQQIIRAFLHHQHYAPWLRPGTGLVLKVVAPFPRQLKWSAS